MSNLVNSKPAEIELSVYHELRASHALPGFEDPHFHVWKIEVNFMQGLPLNKGKVIDLVFLENQMRLVFDPLQGTHLNSALQFEPTSENLALWTWDQVSGLDLSASLSGVKVTLCDLRGNPSGAARLSRQRGHTE